MVNSPLPEEICNDSQLNLHTHQFVDLTTASEIDSRDILENEASCLKDNFLNEGVGNLASDSWQRSAI